MSIRRLRRISKFDLFFNVLIIIFAILDIFPLYWAITGGFKYNHDLLRMPPQWFPLNPTLTNYKDIYWGTNALRWTFNSFYISISTTLLIVIIGSMAAYSLAKLKFFGNRIIFLIFVGALMVPKQILIVPLFKLIVTNFRLMGTYTGVILPNVAMTFGVFLLKQFMDGIPDEIRESAKIDGANELRIFISLIIPMAKPAIGALFIIQFVRVWNDYLWQLVMINKDTMKTLQVGIASMQNELIPNMAYKMAGVTAAAIPMLIVFIIFQRFFTKGITIGAVKG
ncbi:MAG: carbohydrate ABC transporter permease [Spirochaetales bacterium]|nr:carbohydrate ABC transporter permease [Spirochaetales bacterium]